MSQTAGATGFSRAFGYVEATALLWRRRKFIAYVTGGVTVVAIVVSLLMPNYYRSSASLLPETEKNKLMSLSGISDIAALAGVNLGGDASLARLYPSMIRSEAVLKNVIYSRYKTTEFKDSVNLIQFWEIESKTRAREYELALKQLRDAMDIITEPKTGVVTITLETTEPILTADI
ncbi:MAG: Wzz/FepE/Etk N-terminal domain-containing protein, partial [Bacteroidota bacterium]